MKAKLVLDEMPESCGMCRFSIGESEESSPHAVTDNYFCSASGLDCMDITKYYKNSTKHPGCPLVEDKEPYADFTHGDILNAIGKLRVKIRELREGEREI